MANKIQIKRGLRANLPILDSGEFGFCTDTKQTFIGDGTTNYELTTTSYFGADSFLYATTSGVPESKTSAEVLGVLSGKAAAAFDFNSKVVTGVAAPVNASDATNKTYVDTLITAGVSVKTAVDDKDLTTPPDSPTEGDRYWIAATASGTWAGQDYNIAEYNGTGWDFTVTDEGDYAYVDDENVYYYRTASGIEKLASGIGPHAASHTDGTDDIQDATAAQKGLMTASYASKLDGIAAGAEVNPDVVGQAEAEAGVATTERIWTAQRVSQAIAALSTSTFIGSTDTPTTYSGTALNLTRVNAGETGIEFIDFATVYLEDNPTNDETGKAPTSNWAYDHTTAATGVHGAGTETLLHTGSTIDCGAFI